MKNNPRKLVIAGGSGFLGRLLVDWFSESGWQVVVLSRQAQAKSESARCVNWDGKTLGAWTGELEGCDALVNLAGQSVNCRYHAGNRQAILNSRVESTRVLGRAVEQCAHPPRVWLNSSTATIYKHSFDRPMDEPTGAIGGTAEAKDQFSVDVAQAWEQAFNESVVPATRKVALRTAMVFCTTPGTVYRILRRLASLGLGGSMAGGRQYVSWIHQDDFCRAVEWLVERDDLAGPVNLAAPRPLPNHAMMEIIRRACHVPFGLPATRWMLEVGTFLLRTESELIIKSRRVVPARLTEAGFAFCFPNLAGAVHNLEQRLMFGSDAIRQGPIAPPSRVAAP
jgi:uncharacterized protein